MSLFLYTVWEHLIILLKRLSFPHWLFLLPLSQINWSHEPDSSVKDVRNLSGNLFVRNCVESVDFLGNMVILTMLILPIQERHIFFHLFVSVSVSFSSVLQFAKYNSFTSSWIYPRYFILFDTTVNCFLHFSFW